MVVHLWLIYDHIPSRMRPSFKDVTLYQLCYWKVTCIYGLTPEEICLQIQTLIFLLIIKLIQG
jgi:hypothetical protein